jgi:hypothetical protein
MVRIFLVPKIYHDTLKAEIERLVMLGVFKICYNSEWGALTFIITQNNETLRLISDFRRINDELKRKPYPIPKISQINITRIRSFCLCNFS